MRDRVRSAMFEGSEEPTERRQAETRLACSDGIERCPQACPRVVVSVECGIPDAPLAQAAHRVAVPVGILSGMRRVRDVQEAAVLGGKQEDQPVDETQKLLVIGLPGQLAGPERVAQIAVRPVLQKPRAEFAKGGFDAEPELVLCRGAVDAPALAPALERAIGWGRVPGAEAAGMDHQPKHGEIGEEPFGEDSFEVGLDPGGTGKTGIVAHEPERAAIQRDAPKGVFVRVEIFLQELAGRSAAGFVSELSQRLINASLPALSRDKRRDDDGHPAIVRGVPDREPPLGQHDRPGFCHVCKTETVLEQIEDERLRGADIAVSGCVEPLPVSQGDLVVPGDLVAELEARENPVAFIRLVRQVAGRGAAYDFRWQ